MDSVGSAVFDMFMDASGLGDMLGGLLVVIVLPIVIWNTLVCLFGYKLFKIQLAIIGFLFGAVLGAVLGAIGGEAIFAILLGLILGALGAWLSLKLYKIGVFIMVSSSSTLILTVLLGLLLQSFNGAVVTVAAVLGIGLGVLGVFFDKYVIILYTAISGGMLAGIGLGVSMGNVVVGVLIGILLAVLGVWLQFRMERKNGGQPVGPAAAPAALPTQPKAAPALALGDMAKSLTASAKGATDFLMSKAGKRENLNPNQTVLASNKGNYWCKDMPLVVTEVQVASQAGDDEHVYLNIALQNLSDQPIVGIYFDVACQNLLKQELEGLVNLSALDLHIAEGQHWFTTSSIRLPDKTTRKCLLTVKNVVLGNEEIWSNEQGLPLTDIPTAAALALSSELAEEYHLQLAEQQRMRNAAAVYTYAPSFAPEHWYCSCGQLNTTSSQCICCAMDKAALVSLFDQSKLQADREHRIAEKLRLEEERRQKIADQTEAVKQKSLELAGQAKQGYNVAAAKTTELYSVAAAKSREWYATAKAYVMGHQKQVLAGAGAVAVVVVALLGIRAILDAPKKQAPAPSSATSGSTAVPAAGSAVSGSDSADQAAQLAEEKRQYEVKQAKAYLELMNGLLETHQFDFGEGRLDIDGYMYDLDGQVYGSSLNSEGVVIDQDNPAIFFAQQMDMDNNGSQELMLVLGDQFATSIQIWGFDGTSRFQIAQVDDHYGKLMGGMSPQGSYYFLSQYGRGLGNLQSHYYWIENNELRSETITSTEGTSYSIDSQSVSSTAYEKALDKYKDFPFSLILWADPTTCSITTELDPGRLTHTLMASLYQTVLADLALQDGNTPTPDVDLSGVWTSFSAHSDMSAVYELDLKANQTFVMLRWVKESDSFVYSFGSYLQAGDTLYLHFDGDDISQTQRIALTSTQDALILPRDFFEGNEYDMQIRELWKGTSDDQFYIKASVTYRNNPLPRGGRSSGSSAAPSSSSKSAVAPSDFYGVPRTGIIIDKPILLVDIYTFVVKEIDSGSLSSVYLTTEEMRQLKLHKGDKIQYCYTLVDGNTKVLAISIAKLESATHQHYYEMYITMTDGNGRTLDEEPYCYECGEFFSDLVRIDDDDNSRWMDIESPETVLESDGTITLNINFRRIALPQFQSSVEYTTADANKNIIDQWTVSLADAPDLDIPYNGGFITLSPYEHSINLPANTAYFSAVLREG